MQKQNSGSSLIDSYHMITPSRVAVQVHVLRLNLIL